MEYISWTKLPLSPIPPPFFEGKAYICLLVCLFGKSVSLLVWGKGTREGVRGFEFCFLKGNKR